MTAQNKFSELLEKGKIGEQVLKSDFEKSGFVVYSPTAEVSEPFDFFLYRHDVCFLVDVKTYNRLASTPAISIDLPDLEKYIAVENRLKIKMLLYFVDVFEQSIYAVTLERFRNASTRNYKTQKASIHLKETTFFRRLTLEECRMIGNPPPMYNGVARWFDDDRAMTQKKV